MGTRHLYWILARPSFTVKANRKQMSLKASLSPPPPPGLDGRLGDCFCHDSFKFTSPIPISWQLPPRPSQPADDLITSPYFTTGLSDLGGNQREGSPVYDPVKVMDTRIMGKPQNLCTRAITKYT